MSDDTMHGVLIGALDVTGRIEYPEGFTITAQADDATWGNPRAVTRALEDLMRQGARIALDGWENREAFLRVKIKSETGEGLAAGEAALFAELGKRNTLTWTPPGGFAAPTVFVVEWSEMDHEFDSDEETLLGQRIYGIRLVCRPFARSADRWVSEVMSAPPSTVVTPITVDDGTSAAGWSASHGGVVTTTGTAVRATWAEPTPRDVASYHFARNPDIDMTGTKYLKVEWSTMNRADHEWDNVTLTINDVRIPLSRVAYRERTIDGHSIWWILTGTATIRQVGIRGKLVRTTMTPAPGPVAIRPGYLEIHDIDRADQIVASGGTGHQVSHTLMIPGSAPTQGSIHVWDDQYAELGLNDMGDVLVYSGPKDGMVSLEPFVTTASEAFGGTVSGTRKPLTSYVVYDIPATVFDPNRSTGYTLMARLDTTDLAYIDVTVQSIVGQYGGTPIPLGPPQTGRFAPSAGLELASLGAYTVPPMRVDGPAAGLRITVYPTSVTGTPFLDDLWLVNMEDGSLTWIDRSDAGAPIGHVWIEPASVEQPYPRVKIGSGPNGIVGWEAPVRAYGEHDFSPGEVFLRVVATAAPVTKAQVECDVNWHTHARFL